MSQWSQSEVISETRKAYTRHSIHSAPMPFYILQQLSFQRVKATLRLELA
jgi:hypothetical protein